jgi:hypothetical protein
MKLPMFVSVLAVVILFSCSVLGISRLGLIASVIAQRHVPVFVDFWLCAAPSEARIALRIPPAAIAGLVLRMRAH